MIDYSDISNPLGQIDDFNRKVYEAQNNFTGNEGAPMYKAHQGIEMNFSEASNIDETESNIKVADIGRTSIEELTVELRHKYLTILKSIYWEFFEEGQMDPQTVIVLIESADRALDHEELPMKDWEYINSYIVSDSWIATLNDLTHIPLLGRLFNQYLFEHFSLSYDILVNYIEAHEEASHMI